MKSKDPYRIFPPATKEEKDRLKKSIEEVGIRNPVVIDEHGNLIDGHDRRDIADELGIDWKRYAIVKLNLSDDEKRALAIELNLWRKSIIPTTQQKKSLVEKYWPANPKVSENRIADLFGVSQSTANRLKKTLIQAGKLTEQKTTVGTDGVERKTGIRKSKRQGTLMVKNKREFERLSPSLVEAGEDFAELIRHPQKITKAAERRIAQREVAESDFDESPANFKFLNGDFRDLEIETNSVDLIITDPLWKFEAKQDWFDLGVFAKKWLKDTGRLISIIGNESLGQFVVEVSKSLTYENQAVRLFDRPTMIPRRDAVENFRTYLIFKMPKARKRLYSNLLANANAEKKYDDFQQPIEPSRQLIDWFTDDGDLIVDPFLGTGTNAVATALVGGGRTFIGSDIREKMVKTAKHRIQTEGQPICCS